MKQSAEWGMSAILTSQIKKYFYEWGVWWMISLNGLFLLFDCHLRLVSINQITNVDLPAPWKHANLQWYNIKLIKVSNNNV
jgi:hypothetical protein